MRDDDTICAVATAPGEGALGILRLSGPAALPLLRRLCRRRRFESHRLYLVVLRDPRSDDVLERAMACYQRAPRSYTGQDAVELTVHGGELNLARLREQLLALGARHAAPGEFTRRAFLAGHLDLTQAAAVARLIAARSERALRNAHVLLGGALGDRVRTLQAGLVAASARLEAAVDFADDVEEAAALAAARAVCGETRRAVQRLADSHRVGARLDDAVVGLVGPVNVGKSSLFNALLGGARALVDAEPGTTRDYLEAEARWDGHRVLLVDTAGRRERGAATALERDGAALAQPVLARCALLLLVDDVTRPTTPPAPTLPGGAPVLRVANKLDLATVAARAVLAAEDEPPLGTSALTGEGVERLRTAILERLFGGPAAAETLLVTEARHVEALARAAEELTGGEQALDAGLAPELVAEHLRAALAALGEITGEVYTERILDEVFRSFCIGK